MKRQHTKPVSKKELDIRQKVKVILDHRKRHGIIMVPSIGHSGCFYPSWVLHFQESSYKEAVRRVHEMDHMGEQE